MCAWAGTRTDDILAAAEVLWRDMRPHFLVSAPSNAAADGGAQRVARGLVGGDGVVFYPAICRVGHAKSIAPGAATHVSFGAGAGWGGAWLAKRSRHPLSHLGYALALCHGHHPLPAQPPTPARGTAAPAQVSAEARGEALLDMDVQALRLAIDDCEARLRNNHTYIQGTWKALGTAIRHKARDEVRRFARPWGAGACSSDPVRRPTTGALTTARHGRWWQACSSLGAA
jgi:hypothetical protein